jgi:hypothetical protein
VQTSTPFTSIIRSANWSSMQLRACRAKTCHTHLKPS